MNRNCADIGIIQAFLDGELSAEQTDLFTAHIAACDACANSLSQAEDETEAVYAALSREMDSLVPTHRLWSKINDAIEAEAPIGFGARLRSFFAMTLISPSMAAAGGLLIAVLFTGYLLIDRDATTDIVSAPIATVTTSSPAVAVSEESNAAPVEPVLTATDPQDDARSVRPVRAVSAEADQRTFRPQRAVYIEPSSTDAISGEENYVKTIASLSRVVGGQANDVMRPAEVVAFERNMAIVDDTITRMRKAIRKDPRNETAKQMLYASYQDKIDLLNSISQREELVAGIR
jgi:anti-sigma factor RsiW